MNFGSLNYSVTKLNLFCNKLFETKLRSAQLSNRKRGHVIVRQAIRVWKILTVPPLETINFVFFAGIPVAEKFSFCLHTILCDVAVLSPPHCEEIISTQIECLQALQHSIQALHEQTTNSSASKLYLCRSIVPVFLGLSRAMGRFTPTDPPLISRIYPRPKLPNNFDQALSQPTAKKGNFSHFRPIIPRSLSQNLSNAFSKIDIAAVTQVIKVLYSSSRHTPQTERSICDTCTALL